MIHLNTGETDTCRHDDWLTKKQAGKQPNNKAASMQTIRQAGKKAGRDIFGVDRKSGRQAVMQACRQISR